MIYISRFPKRMKSELIKRKAKIKGGKKQKQNPTLSEQFQHPIDNSLEDP